MCALRAVLPTLSEKPEEMQGGSAGLVVVSMCISAYKRLFCCVRSAQNCAHSETTTRQFVVQSPTLPSDKGATLADALAKDRNKTPPPCPSDRSRIPCILAIYFNLLFIICFFLSFFHGMHPRREALCGSVRRFPVPGGSFPVEQVKRLTRAYSV